MSSLSKVFDKSGDIIDAIKKLIDDDTSQFSKSLGQASGVIALVRVGIDLYRGIQNELKTDEQKAFGALLKIVFESADEILDEIKNEFLSVDEIEIENPEKRKIMHKLLDSFGQTSGWNSYLPEHPSVREFRKIITSYLRERNIDSKAMNEFIFRFNLRIESKASNNEHFKEFYEWWTLEKQYDELKKYLEYVKNKMYYLEGIDKKPLYEHYVWNKAVVATVNTWNWNDKQFYKSKKYSTRIRDIRKIIKEFLQSEDKWYLVIGAPFGTGKTSMVRMIASLYASSYLNQTEDEERQIAILNSGSDKQYFVPIPVFLKAGLNNVYKNFDLDDVLSDIAPYDESNPAAQQAARRPLLLILDSLDEYRKGNVEDLIRNTIFDRIHKKYRKNMKVIITTRLKPEFPKLLDISDSVVDSETQNAYVRLLPFSLEQIDEFFQKSDAPLTYEDVVSNFGLHHYEEYRYEEIKKPLFAWMLTLMYNDPEYKIDFPKNWNDDMKRSFIYMLFIHFIIEGKHKRAFQLESDKWTRRYVHEKKTLRKIGALKQLKGDLNIDELDQIKLDTIKDIAPYDQSTSGTTIRNSSLLTSYFYLRDDVFKGEVVEFIHETFNDYLLAEYYIECLLENKLYRLNVGTPSEETILFLRGLLQLLKVEPTASQNDPDDLVNKTSIDRAMKFISGGETNFLASLASYQKKPSELLDTLISNASRGAESEYIIFTEGKPAPSVLKEDKLGTWKEGYISDKDFLNLWIHRWISLFIIKSIHPTRKIDNKAKLVNLVKYSSGHVPGLLINLSSSDLSHADFSRADLSDAELSNADLSHAYLSHTKFFNSDLSRADLSDVNLSHANLSHADLSHAYLSRAVMSDANLSHADLSHVYVSHADLSHANLFGSIIIGLTGTEALKCEGAKFERALLNDENLLIYFYNNNAINLPSVIVDKNELKNRLIDRGFSQEYIDSLL